MAHYGQTWRYMLEMYIHGRLNSRVRFRLFCRIGQNVKSPHQTVFCCRPVHRRIKKETTKALGRWPTIFIEQDPIFVYGSLKVELHCMSVCMSTDEKYYCVYLLVHKSAATMRSADVRMSMSSANSFTIKRSSKLNVTVQIAQVLWTAGQMTAWDTNLRFIAGK